MAVKYICPYWGIEHLTPDAFVGKAMDAGYDGVELNLPDDASFVASLSSALQTHNAVFVAQQWLPPADESFSRYRHRMTSYLNRLADAGPSFINSHTGKDYFSFDENCQLIEACGAISSRKGVPIVHETHRGRFAFHARSVIPYLERYPDLALNADLSHFCVVSESLLEDQEALLETIIRRSHYVHARVGCDQAPQVNHPFAPEWESTRLRFLRWWQRIIDAAYQRGQETFCVCPEFGPAPYMPALPFTQRPVADQWETNLEMLEFLKENLRPGNSS